MTIPEAASRARKPNAFSQPTVALAFAETATERPDDVALRTFGGSLSITWGEYAAWSGRIAAGLAASGIGRGDRVAFMATNRSEFHVADTAAMQLGATCFSIYNTLAPEQIAFLLSDAAPRIVVCEAQFVSRLQAAAEQAGVAPALVVLDGDDASAGATTLADLERLGEPGFDLDAARRAVEPGDTIGLIYTSGTTGPPKGVMLTHANVMAEANALQDVLALEPGGRIVSYLPAAHVADRLLSHWWQSICLGMTVTSCPEVAQVFAAAVEVRPTIFGGVPRIWEKLQAALEAGFAAEPDEARRSAVRAAIDTGIARLRAEQSGQTPSAELLERDRALEPVRAAVRERVGLGECELFVAGAAATPVAVQEFFHGLGIGICELWGMSETTGVGTVNPPDAIRVGTVGPPIPGAEVRLGDDGEVFVRGPMIMKGYLNLPDKTSETIDAEGWLATGDVGRIDDAGYLKIVDRKKELIINAAGKNMSPANIESALKSGSPLIGQACAIGDGRPYNVALIVLDPDGAAAFARARNIEGSSTDLAGHPDVRAEVEAGVGRGNERLARVEQIKRFTILPVDWLPGGDELTPTMKLKRKPIAIKYADDIERLYA